MKHFLLILCVLWGSCLLSETTGTSPTQSDVQTEAVIDSQQDNTNTRAAEVGAWDTAQQTRAATVVGNRTKLLLGLWIFLEVLYQAAFAVVMLKSVIDINRSIHALTLYTQKNTSVREKPNGGHSYAALLTEVSPHKKKKSRNTEKEIERIWKDISIDEET